MEINGLPAHPLLVHLPVVLIPLALVGVIMMVARHSWFVRYRWAVLAISIVGGVGAFLTMEAGETLEEQLEEVRGEAFERAIQDHANAGQLGAIASILFMLTVVAFIFLPTFINRKTTMRDDDGNETVTTSGPSWLRPGLGALSIIIGAIAIFGLIQAGETGARSVWADDMEAIDGAFAFVPMLAATRLPPRSRRH